MPISPATEAAIRNNPLLVKHTVGETRHSVYDLPGKDHVYGKKVERNPEECAAQVLQNWNVKAKSKHAVPALDYISMNRNTAKQGITDPTEIRKFRKSHPIRLKIGDVELDNNARSTSEGVEFTSIEIRKQRLVGQLPHDKDPNFIYGKPTRPSTPVARLMTDEYQQNWITEQEKRIAREQQQEKEKTKKKQTKSVSPAKVALQPKKRSIVDKDPKSLFKMSKFASLGPKTSSWRQQGDPVLMRGKIAGGVEASGSDKQQEKLQAKGKSVGFTVGEGKDVPTTA